ncbi:ABC-F family ATP-binding cassette domain-containing protein [Sphingomonas sp. PR090111-T3T-6A]|uniref:ABC-F family ATP-binding cassette domain-containing protein n=1 Tax=Sphingomonas sp. PR090111-T3T-6A TaxID=685778 RepID=UPI0003646875|nr:ABC-F family ATP-binding cassette domain-containing protein [Sphingomonas sp. PR090111-T3T-6A]
MPASISVSHLAWSTPDGRAVLDDLTLDFGRERAGLVGRNGVGKSTLLRLLTRELEPSRGTVRVQGTIGTLRQIVQLSPRETLADLLGIADGLALLHRAEAGGATLDELEEADWTLEARAMEALAQVGLDLPLDAPLVRLSGGQRTRAALAGAIFAAPDFLLLDEPTNNLDRDGRQAVHDLLQDWRAGAIIVSHDRELLDTMDAIVELTTLGAQRYGGNWSRYRERKAIELAAAEQDLASAERRVAEVARKARITTERQQRRDATGSRQAAKGGMPRILLGARKERAENSGGGNVRLADRLRADASLALDRAKEKVERVETFSVQLAPTGLAPTREVLALDDVTAGYDPAEPVLRNLSLKIVGPERVAVVGANGSGKSTLLRVITGDLAPFSGRVAIHVPAALLDQRVGLLDPDETIAENYARLNPGVDENGCWAALARFRFRAEAGDRRVGTLSGGQTLRAGLACVLGSPTPPPLLMLDEPTNHLDIESVMAVEAGLRAYDGALLVVSHDAAFLENIGVTRRLSLDP